jgi:hypothetical protein
VLTCVSPFCAAAKDGSEDSEKAQFEPLEKGEQSPEKDPVKEGPPTVPSRSQLLEK